MRPRAALIPLLALALLAPAGCVERRIRITSEPAGALVRLNDIEVGATPLEVDFTYYGVYDVRVTKEGYQPLITSAEAKAPWWETPGADLVAEAWPGRNISLVEWSFTLVPASDDPDQLIQRARELRAREALPEPPPAP
jgi:hypothetical protein